MAVVTEGSVMKASLAALVAKIVDGMGPGTIERLGGRARHRPDEPRLRHRAAGTGLRVLLQLLQRCLHPRAIRALGVLARPRDRPRDDPGVERCLVLDLGTAGQRARAHLRSRSASAKLARNRPHCSAQLGMRAQRAAATRARSSGAVWPSASAKLGGSARSRAAQAASLPPAIPRREQAQPTFVSPPAMRGAAALARQLLACSFEKPSIVHPRFSARSISASDVSRGGW
jgi:hypothetical protein